MDIKNNGLFLPLTTFRDVTGFVVNGERQDSLLSTIEKCARVYAVDGGLHHLKGSQVHLDWFVGDCDSVQQKIIDSFPQTFQTLSLNRDKETTDLEKALSHADESDKTAYNIIFDGTGGRIDHTLSHLLILMRDSQIGRTFIQTKYETIFAINASTGKVIFDEKYAKTIGLFPLCGPCYGVRLVRNEYKEVFENWTPRKNCYFSTEGTNSVWMEGEGTLLIVLDSRKLLRTIQYPKITEKTQDFSSERALIELLEVFAVHHQEFDHDKSKRFVSSKNGAVDQSVTLLKEDSRKVVFPCKRGETVSLIPIFGAADKIATEGLLWEISEDRVLSKEFVGISNVATGSEFSVQVKEGSLLVVRNHQLIDMEMLEKKDAK